MLFPLRGAEFENSMSVLLVCFKHISWSFIDLPRCWFIKGFRAKPLSQDNKQGQNVMILIYDNDARFLQPIYRERHL